MRLIKWAQTLGDPTCPYMTRWVVNLGLITIRLHCFHRSDDDRHLHDHPWWFFSALLRGSYREHTDSCAGPWRKVGSIVYRPALTKHRVEIKPGRSCWTLCVTGPTRRHWGFWVHGAWLRSRDYFGKFGHPPCQD